MKSDYSGLTTTLTQGARAISREGTILPSAVATLLEGGEPVVNRLANHHLAQPNLRQLAKEHQDVRLASMTPVDGKLAAQAYVNEGPVSSEALNRAQPQRAKPFPGSHGPGF